MLRKSREKLKKYSRNRYRNISEDENGKKRENGQNCKSNLFEYEKQKKKTPKGHRKATIKS